MTTGTLGVMSVATGGGMPLAGSESSKKGSTSRKDLLLYPKGPFSAQFIAPHVVCTPVGPRTPAQRHLSNLQSSPAHLLSRPKADTPRNATPAQAPAQAQAIPNNRATVPKILLFRRIRLVEVGQATTYASGLTGSNYSTGRPGTLSFASALRKSIHVPSMHPPNLPSCFPQTTFGTPFNLPRRIVFVSRPPAQSAMSQIARLPAVSALAADVPKGNILKRTAPGPDTDTAVEADGDAKRPAKKTRGKRTPTAERRRRRKAREEAAARANLAMARSEPSKA
ncbi:hypothetical protein L227DRAFT_617918 [Lentinus tigrinus ALCF2SS1-6]|uniref:Uncharacterized protein n=1 Tax=Lentinus tigrinus ALCF2SS1-6 TaxID=1328759 RepID=A0A5C2RN57_9APHY|nr:hypothetical protein L227DRAFT_617918 [Lentinus tigrinus ALCF2SS1-6]